MEYQAISLHGENIVGYHIRSTYNKGRLLQIEIYDCNAHYEYQVGDMSAWVEIDPKTLKEIKEVI